MYFYGHDFVLTIDHIPFQDQEYFRVAAPWFRFGKYNCQLPLLNHIQVRRTASKADSGSKLSLNIASGMDNSVEFFLSWHNCLPQLPI